MVNIYDVYAIYTCILCRICAYIYAIYVYICHIYHIYTLMCICIYTYTHMCVYIHIYTSYRYRHIYTNIYHTAVLSIVIKFCIASLVHIYLNTGSLYHLNTIIQLFRLLIPTTGNHKSNLSFCFVFLDYTCNWDYTVFAFLLFHLWCSTFIHVFASGTGYLFLYCFVMLCFMPRRYSSVCVYARACVCVCIYGLQIFFPILQVVFSFCWLILWLCTSFLVWCQFTYLCSCLCFWCHIQKDHCQDSCWRTFS